MMKQCRTRLCSALLAVALLLTMLPTYALAGDSTATRDATSTITAQGGALGSGVYTLNADVTLVNTLTVAVGENVTIDLNGFILSIASNRDVIENSGTLTVKNGTVAGKNDEANSQGMAVDNLTGATLTVTQDEGKTTKLVGRSGIQNSGTATVYAGTIESYNRNAYYGDIGSKLTVYDGTFTSPSGSSGMGRAISASGDVTIYGGSFYAGGSSGAGDAYVNAIGMYNDGELVIKPSDGKNVTVTSETDYAVATSSSTPVQIYGGSFACNGVRTDVLHFNSSQIQIYGGTFKHKPYAEYLAENRIVIEAENGYVINTAATPTDVSVSSYDQLTTALNGSVLEPKNITFTGDVTIPANADLTLQRGYTLTVEKSAALNVEGILRLNGTMTNNGTLTVGDQGFVEYPLNLTNNGTIIGYPTVENNVCTVSTPMQLQWLSCMVEWDNDHIPDTIQLKNSISMPDVVFTPIGCSSDGFYYYSVFDGCGYAISALNIVATEEYRSGLFGHVGDITIKNLTISGTSTNSTSSYIGALAGYMAGNCTVSNVHIKNYTVSSPISYGVGGFVGQIRNEANERIEFIGCSLDNVKVTGYANVGGIWGTSTGSEGTIGIYNCNLAGTVETINVNGATCGGYGASAKVEIIGLDRTGLTATVKDTATENLVAYTETEANSQNYANGSQYIAVKGENGWDAKNKSDFAAMVTGIPYANLFDAIAAAGNGDTVTLLKQYEGDAITIDKAITIDLGTTGTDNSKFMAGTNYQVTVDANKMIFGLTTHTVAFNSNGGSAVASTAVEHGSTVAKPADPTRQGYIFAGWYSNEALTTAYDFGTAVTGDITLYAKWTEDTSSGGDTGSGSSGSSGGSSGSSGNKTETTTNPDGSTTTTVTKPDGSTTETTTNTDGSQQVVATDKDGTVTTTTTDTDGNKTETVEKTDGTSQTTVTNKDGSSSTTKTDVNGKTEAEVKLPDAVVNDATDKGEAVTLPMPQVSAAADKETAPTVTVNLPGSSTEAKVEIPVEHVTSGTVAVLVNADGTEEIIKTSLPTENGVSVTLSDGATVKIVDNAKAFDDVADSYWGSEEITFAASRELMGGTSSTTFTPEGDMTRAMVVTVLARYEGVDTDTGDTWYDAGRDWAMQTGISDGSDMHSSVTREQLAAMLYRYAGEPAVSGTVSGFRDAHQISDWAQNAMLWSTQNGLIGGMGNNLLEPQGTATRAQVAAILARFVALTA